MAHELNKTEAFRKDSEFYVEYDEEYNDYGVFGDDTGFCYLLSSEEDCEEEAERLSVISKRLDD